MTQISAEAAMNPQSSFFRVPLRGLDEIKRLRQETKRLIRQRIEADKSGELLSRVSLSNPLIGGYRKRTKLKKSRHRFVLLPGYDSECKKCKRCGVGAARMDLAIGDV